jgi:hypothetical protein
VIEVLRKGVGWRWPGHKSSSQRGGESSSNGGSDREQADQPGSRPNKASILHWHTQRGPPQGPPTNLKQWLGAPKLITSDVHHVNSKGINQWIVNH